VKILGLQLLEYYQGLLNCTMHRDGSSPNNFSTNGEIRTRLRPRPISTWTTKPAATWLGFATDFELICSRMKLLVMLHFSLFVCFHGNLLSHYHRLQT